MGIDIGHIQTGKSEQTIKVKSKNNISVQYLFSQKSINNKKKTIFYKDLHLLLNAEINLKTALTIVKNQQTNPHIISVLDEMLKNIVDGMAFNDAMKASGKFSDYEIFSVKIGENTRQLNMIFNELEKYFQRKVKLKKRMTSILTYPALILVLTFGTLYFMLTYVVPLFETVFNQFGKELPSLTKYIIALSEHFNTIILGFGCLILLIALIIRRIRDKDAFRNISSLIILRIPFFSSLVKQIYLTRFCQSMALLLVSKTSLVESLELIQKMIGYYPIEKALPIISIDIKKGKTLGESMSKFKIFDRNLVSMIKVAERVNQLDGMFKNLANQYDNEVEHKTKIMGTVIEPLLILFIGGIVGIIMISMYAPMFDLSKVIGAG